MSPPVDTVRGDGKLPAAADVVVIGGGIIGCSAAYFLAKKGLSVAVIEKGQIAGEQSSRNWGWCRQQGRDTREIPLIKESLTLWRGLNEEVGADTGFRRTGLLYVTKDAAELARWERWRDHARQYQIHTRLLSAAEAQAMMPGCEEKWIGGLHTPSDGRAEPAKAAPAIVEAARRLGVTLHQGCAARSRDQGRCRLDGRDRRGRHPHPRRPLRGRGLVILILPTARPRFAAAQRARLRTAHRASTRCYRWRDRRDGLRHPSSP